ncbi:glycosyltransferase family 87 protein [Burkholderia sp. L27(2015)]|uniref:glycosyltransferase family 87 protein n=1 Tax=Burkholderia sp. L27(2015) TaxID=1641858 RepID=UPI00131DC894|nr:glycosyltransferase family 87 protein [Burkholderia sp. L27(2015)]
MKRKALHREGFLLFAQSNDILQMTDENPCIESAPGPVQPWLNASRLRAYLGTLFFVLQMAMLAVSCWVAWHIYSQPCGFDFQTFWAASRLTLQGTPLLAYSPEAIAHTAQQIGPHTMPLGPWRYPPNFLLLVEPLGLLPCPISYLIFGLVTTTIFIRMLRRALPMADAMVWILAFPGLWLNATQGQNGSVTAIFALAAFFFMQKKRPVLAGVCIGMLSIKPHLAILFPLALACAEMWTTFIAAAVTTVLFTGLSIAVFGVAVIPAFLHGISGAGSDLENGAIPWQQMASLFAALRDLRIAIAPAYVAQGCGAIVAACVTAWVWRNSDELEVKATALVAGTFMISPYIYNYDAVWLGIPVALLTAKGLRDGWLRWERPILMVAFLYPLFGNETAYAWRIGLGPLVFAALLFVSVRRVTHHRSVLARFDPKVQSRLAE